MTDQDPAGWYNTCCRMLADGQICGRRYWFAWHASAGSGRRTVARDSTELHTCREVDE